MDAGLAADPPAGATPTTETELDALRARLLDTETRLSQTQQDLSTAITAAGARDALDAAARDTRNDGRAPADAGRRGGQTADRGAAAAAAPADALVINGDDVPNRDAGGDAPLDGAAAADYEDPGDGATADGDDGGWAGGEGGRYRGYRGRAHRTADDDAGAYDDGFDFKTTFTPSDWLQSFDIPRSVLRDDGLPMPFTPTDPVHTATFQVGSRDEIEARHWYCVLAWLQQIFNDTLDVRFARGNTVATYEELVDYLVGATRRTYALGVSRYDYLALRQSEPSLADAFAHADAVPRNSLRGDGARRFISRVVRAETTASAKIGAAERGYSYPHRGGRATPQAPAATRTAAQRRRWWQWWRRRWRRRRWTRRSWRRR
eukprot:TRINITY_DN2687_c0_g1_i2.p2 TRINITY_DN2687_c0_g1~~TRINITY_DN2687_c0_g1_i2.p2  ORF type:complete len:376 (-),score=85.04 TRINITY_DN2687_c0_g1_i2:14-1141(-)